MILLAFPPPQLASLMVQDMQRKHVMEASQEEWKLAEKSIEETIWQLVRTTGDEIKEV